MTCRPVRASIAHRWQDARLHPAPGAKVVRGNPDRRVVGRVNNAVLVLNQNYEPLNVCNVRRAMVLVIDGKAEVLEARPRPLSSATAVVPRPLRDPARLPDPAPPAAGEAHSPRNLHPRQLHLPVLRAAGNRPDDRPRHPALARRPHVWDNLVSACKACNHRKGGKSIAEARMALHKEPHEPRPASTTRSSAGWIRRFRPTGTNSCPVSLQAAGLSSSTSGSSRPA